MIGAPDMASPVVTVDGETVRVRTPGQRTLELDPAAAARAARWLDDYARQLEAAARVARGRL